MLELNQVGPQQRHLTTLPPAYDVDWMPTGGDMHVVK